MTQETEKIEIDGDKVIAFIKAVKDLGGMMEAINIVGIKDAFLVGMECKEVDRVIKIRADWSKTIKGIMEAFDSDEKIMNRGRDCARDMVSILSSFRSLANNPEYNQGIAKVTELADLCDRIEKHRQSGVLEILKRMI